jgi:phosphatidylglycerophosphatase B
VRDRQSQKLYICAALCAFLFAVLALGVANGRADAFDAAIRNQIHAHATSGFTEIAQLLSLTGSAIVWVPGLAVAIVAFWMIHDRRRAFALAIVMAGATLLDNGLKLVFHRVRPDVFFGVLPDTFSFPSGHALFSLCFYGALGAVFATQLRSTAIRIAIWILIAFLVLCIGLSRIYLGVHYPTDVLAGFLAGGAWLSGVCGTGLVRSARPS